MKVIYPVVFTKLDDGYMVYVPDMEINTQGDDLAEAIDMARDAIGIMCIDMQDDKKPLPAASDISSVVFDPATDIVTLVDIDLAEYRRKHDMRTVKKNCTIPSWLNYEAEKAGVNFSAILQAALKRELNLPAYEQ